MTSSDGLFGALRNIQRQARLIAAPENATVQAIRSVGDTLALADATPELEQRDKTYFAVPENQLANPGFTDNLTSWTETIDGTVTATTARDTSQSKTLYGSLASLKIDMTASSGTGDAQRAQAVTAAAAEVWSFEAWVRATVLTNCKAVVKIEWLDGGLSVLATQTVEVTAINSAFTLRQIQNQTAPSSTASVRVSCILEATASGAVGTVYFDLTRAEQGESVVSDRASRIIAGEFVAT